MRSSPRRKLTSLLFGLSGLAFGIVGAENTFGRLRDAGNSPPLVFSVEVRDEAGALLASPLLVGEEGRRLHLDLSHPRSAGGGDLCLEYRLSFDGERARGGHMSVPMGQRRSVQVPGPGEPLRLSLVVARAGTPEFQRLLLERRLGKPVT